MAKRKTMKRFRAKCLTPTFVIARDVYRIAEEKERLRRALIAYGVPIPAEGGTLAEWAELLEKEVMARE